ncbi:MAG: insulinase family protein [Ignavibacteriota bacterium]
MWFLLESQRMAHPVFRDLYRQRARLASDVSNLLAGKSTARLRQSLLSTAFENSPYRNPVLGWPSDAANLRLVDARNFFDTYCGPGNTVIAMVGDIDAANARQLAERYFGAIPGRPFFRYLLWTRQTPVDRDGRRYRRGPTPGKLAERYFGAIPGRPSSTCHAHAGSGRRRGPKTIAVWADSQTAAHGGVQAASGNAPRRPRASILVALVLGDSRTGLVTNRAW